MIPPSMIPPIKMRDTFSYGVPTELASCLTNRKKNVEPKPILFY